MKINYTFEFVIYLILTFMILLFFIGLLVAFVSWLNKFQKELNRLNLEINRTRGEEREHWKRQKRRLWLSIIPFFKY